MLQDTKKQLQGQIKKLQERLELLDTEMIAVIRYDVNLERGGFWHKINVKIKVRENEDPDAVLMSSLSNALTKAFVRHYISFSDEKGRISGTRNYRIDYEAETKEEIAGTLDFRDTDFDEAVELANKLFMKII